LPCLGLSQLNVREVEPKRRIEKKVHVLRERREGVHIRIDTVVVRLSFLHS
jgi:hypothetical protein